MQTNNYGCWLNTVECEMIILSTAATTVSFSTPGTRPRRGLWKKSMSRWQQVFWQVFFYHYDVLLWKCHSRIDIWYTFWIPTMTLKMGKKFWTVAKWKFPAVPSRQPRIIFFIWFFSEIEVLVCSKSWYQL